MVDWQWQWCLHPQQADFQVISLETSVHSETSKRHGDGLVSSTFFFNLFPAGRQQKNISVYLRAGEVAQLNISSFHGWDVWQNQYKCRLMIESVQHDWLRHLKWMCAYTKRPGQRTKITKGNDVLTYFTSCGRIQRRFTREKGDDRYIFSHLLKLLY